MTYKHIAYALLAGTSMLAAAPMAFAQSADTAAPEQAAEEADDGVIIVTARRREESLQNVPLSVAAFDSQTLERSTVQSMQDIGSITPGLRFGVEGGKTSAAVSLRGIGQTPVGGGTPGVALYFADVPLSSEGSNIPTYDLANVQVLKGPQGTLFGRNTLGGAVLINPQAPTDDFEGYVEATYGRFDYRELEGAINIPLGEIGAFRAAGQIRRQDGRTENLSGGPDFDNIKQDSFRLSLRLDPFDGFSSTTIFDWYKSRDRAAGIYLYEHNIGAVPGLSALIDPQIAAAFDVQQQNFHGAFAGEGGAGKAHSKTWMITNRTSYEFGNFTLRNIFGYRESKQEQLINSGAVPTLDLFGPFTLFSASGLNDRQYLTNETQILADFDGIELIGGFFYSNDKSAGASGSGFKAFAPVSRPRPAVSVHYENTSYAIFGQVGIDITDKLSLDLGGRYSWDKVSSCGGSIPGGYATVATCVSIADLGLTTDGVGTVGNSSEEPSWTIALNYQMNDDVLVYATTRRGHRAASVNTPLFESGFTTGGIEPGCAFTTPPATGLCPDLRPFQTTGEEKLTDFEIGLKSKFTLGSGRGHFNIAAFYNDYKNALQFLNVLGTGIPQQGAPDTPNRTAVATNAADLEIYGLELDASLSPSSNFTVFMNGAITESKVKSISLPPLAGFNFSATSVTLPTPKIAGTFGLSWVMPVRPADGELVFNADIYMTDDFGGQTGVNLPGYRTANARIDWKDIGQTGLDIGFYVKNLFDEEYFSSPVILGLPIPVATVYTGEQRTWGISARYSF